jgi:transmembrane sensor
MREQDRQRLAELADKWLAGQLNPAEKQAFEAWLDEVHDQPLEMPADAGNDEAFEAMLLQKIQGQIGSGRTYRLWPRISAAAAILVFLSFGGYFLLHRQKPIQQFSQNQQPVILPGGNKATLTLANGQTIILTNAKPGRIAKQSHAVINKTKNGTIVYQSGAAGAENQQIAYNTMTTPRGGQYPVQLPDGSYVLLNAASSLRYPTVFSGKERIVELTGEAYFEVVHNAKQPFKVITRTQTVEDLGTHFVINAYTDEPTIKTTLLQGSVKVTAAGQNSILKPGQQTLFDDAHPMEVIRYADTEAAMDWVNGNFVFNSEDLGSILRKIARWYNVDIQYEDQLAQKTFTGSISRYKNVSEVLDLLQTTNLVHFNIAGRRILVRR